MTSPAVFGQPIQAQPEVSIHLWFAEPYTDNIYSGDWVTFYRTLCEASIS